MSRSRRRSASEDEARLGLLADQTDTWTRVQLRNRGQFHQDSLDRADRSFGPIRHGEVVVVNNNDNRFSLPSSSHQQQQQQFLNHGSSSSNNRKRSNNSGSASSGSNNSRSSVGGGGGNNNTSSSSNNNNNNNHKNNNNSSSTVIIGGSGAHGIGLSHLRGYHPYQHRAHHHHYQLHHGSSFASTLARYDFISHEVQPGDTLAGIALRYNCKLALLKQANNIASEVQLAALPTVRVPVPRNGVQVVTGQLVDISGKVEIEREASPRDELCPQRFMADLDEKLRLLQEQALPAAGPGRGAGGGGRSDASGGAAAMSSLVGGSSTSSSPLPPPTTTRTTSILSSSSSSSLRGHRNGHKPPRPLFNSTCLMISCLVGVCVGLPILYTLYILTNPLHGDAFRLIPS